MSIVPSQPHKPQTSGVKTLTIFASPIPSLELSGWPNGLSKHKLAKGEDDDGGCGNLEDWINDTRVQTETTHVWQSLTTATPVSDLVPPPRLSPTFPLSRVHIPSSLPAMITHLVWHASLSLSKKTGHNHQDGALGCAEQWGSHWTLVGLCNHGSPTSPLIIHDWTPWWPMSWPYPITPAAQQHLNVSACPCVPTQHRTSNDNSNDNSDAIMTTMTSLTEQLGSACFQALFKSAVPHAPPLMYHCYWWHNAPFWPQCPAQPCVISRLSR